MAEGFWRQTSDNKLTAAAYSEMTPPTGHDFVPKSTIEASYSGEIWQDGVWNGTTYTPPPDILIPYDGSTNAGEVQLAAEAMLDVLEAGADYIRDNRIVWPQDAVEWALDGLHFQISNAARIALNPVRTPAYRSKFLEEVASWPTGVSGDAASYVDAFVGGSITEAPGPQFAWVDPDEDPPIRTDTSAAYTTFTTTTNVEDAPVTAKLLGRRWILDIPA